MYRLCAKHHIICIPRPVSLLNYEMYWKKYDDEASNILMGHYGICLIEDLEQYLKLYGLKTSKPESLYFILYSPSQHFYHNSVFFIICTSHYITF